MDKPLMVVRQELIDNLVVLINKSGLPPVVTVPILEGLLAEAKDAMDRQYLMEKEAYEKTVAENSGEKK